MKIGLKSPNLAFLIVGTFAGIALGRFFFPQTISSNVLAPSIEQPSKPKPAKPDGGGAHAADARSIHDRKGSPRGSAAERLAKFMAEHPSIDERSDFIQELISKLCSQGRDNEAYALIDANPGQLREAGLFSFYTNASLDKGSLMEMLKGEHPADLHTAFLGYMQGNTIDQLKEETESPRLAEFWRERGSEMPSDLISTAITVSLRNSLTEADHSESLKALQLVRNLAEKGVMESHHAYEIIDRDNNLSPLEKWSLLRQIDPKSKAMELKYRDKLIDSMIRSNSSEAMASVLSNQTPNQTSDVNSAVRAWNKADPSGLVNWYQQNQSTLSQEGRTMVATTLSTMAAEHGEFESAKQWANQIQNPAKNAEVMKMLDEKSLSYQEWLQNKQ